MLLPPVFVRFVETQDCRDAIDGNENAALFSIWLGRQDYAGLRPSPLRGRLRRSNPLRGFVEP
jgi:hypothetical protein